MLTPRNMAKIVTRFANTNATRIRVTYSINADGLRAESTASVAIKVNMQPLPGADLQRLPEGFHDRDNQQVWSISELRDRDILVIGSARYEISKVQDWNSNGLYWSAMATRQHLSEHP